MRLGTSTIYMQIPEQRFHSAASTFLRELYFKKGANTTAEKIEVLRAELGELAPTSFKSRGSTVNETTVLGVLEHDLLERNGKITIEFR